MALRMTVVCLVLTTLWSWGLADGFGSMVDLCQKIAEKSDKDSLCGRPSFKRNCGAVLGCPGSQTNTSPAPTTTATTPKRHCDKRSPCIPKSQANQLFKQRCQAAGLPGSCVPHCNYDEGSDTLKPAFTSAHECSLNDLRTYLQCASDDKDNSGCCADTGVLSQRKTGVCGVFCNPNGPDWPSKGQALKYAPCVNVLTGIMQCHYYAQGAD